MWSPKKEEEASRPAPSMAPAPKEVRPMEFSKPAVEPRVEVAHIGKSVLIKGELSGSEDLYLDGEVEGSVDLKGHGLTIGPHGRVKAHTQASEVIVHGKVEGNIRAERVELKRSAIVTGDITTERVTIEDGAYLKGAIDVQREQRHEPKPAAAAAAAGASGGGQGSLLETKR